MMTSPDSNLDPAMTDQTSPFADPTPDPTPPTGDAAVEPEKRLRDALKQTNPWDTSNLVDGTVRG